MIRKDVYLGTDIIRMARETTLKRVKKKLFGRQDTYTIIKLMGVKPYNFFSRSVHAMFT
jgi:hypothetical protein